MCFLYVMEVRLSLRGFPPGGRRSEEEGGNGGRIWFERDIGFAFHLIHKLSRSALLSSSPIGVSSRKYKLRGNACAIRRMATLEERVKPVKPDINFENHI